MLGSLRLLRQMAHVSAQMSQDHIATAFHFLISNRGATCNTHATRYVTCTTESQGNGETRHKGTHPTPCHAMGSRARLRKNNAARAKAHSSGNDKNATPHTAAKAVQGQQHGTP